MHRRAPLLAVGLVGVITVACTTHTAERRGVAVVIDVVDGDTIDVRVQGRDERVRLIGVDTPETKRPDAPVECHGPDASAFTASLLPVGTEVRLERDLVGRDHFGRLLGYVHLPATASGAEIFVNLEIVEQGHGVPLVIEPNDLHASALAAAAARAEAADLGLWGACRD